MLFKKEIGPVLVFLTRHKTHQDNTKNEGSLTHAANGFYILDKRHRLSVIVTH